MTDAADLVGWLRAQVDTDERLASEAFGDSWEVMHGGVQTAEPANIPGYIFDGEKVHICRVLSTVGNFGAEEDNAQFIAANDPARVLAEVQSKRRILDEAQEYRPELEHGDNGEWAFDFVLRALALAYRDREGYREEWAP